MGLASRFPIDGTTVLSRGPYGGFGALAVRYELATPVGTVHFLNLHPDTPRHGLEHVLSAWWGGAESLDHNTEIRRRESESAAALLDDVEGPILVAGDFNMPIESAIYRRYWSQYTNAFSAAGFGFGYTYGRTRKLCKWVRIDHVLASADWRVRRCWVGPYVGSDHWPILAELETSSHSSN
jgi:endonuclease/exonuclease/phosphatase family metal-dependent hydrolase